jgi:hypothetical protein
MRCAPGVASTSSSSHLLATSSNSNAIPVRLPSERARLPPIPIVLEMPTIGKDWIVARAASTASEPETTIRS